MDLKTLVDLSQKEFKANNLKDCIEHSIKAINKAHELNDFGTAAEMNTLLGDAYQRTGEMDTALKSYQLAISYYEKSLNSDKTTLGKIYARIGTFYMSISNYVSSIKYYEQAVEIFNELEDQQKVANCYNNIALVHMHLADYQNALRFNEKNLIIQKQTGNKLFENLAYINIGIIYFYMEQYDKALSYWQLVYENKELLKNHHGFPSVLGNLSNVYVELQKWDKALQFQTEALELFKMAKRPSNVALTTGNLGRIHLRRKNLDKAFEYFESAIELFNNLGDKMHESSFMRFKAIVLADKSYSGYDLEKAEKVLFEAFSMAEQIKSNSGIAEIFESISNLYEQKNDWEAAYKYFKKYYELNKQIIGEKEKEEAKMMDHRRKIEDAERDRQVKIARFQEQEKILHNILPKDIAERIIAGEEKIADSYQNISIFFSDIIGFTSLSSKIAAEDLVDLLNEVFAEFDKIAENHGLEKIKTIGDAYMAVAGAPRLDPDHALNTARFAKDVLKYILEFKNKSKNPIEIRIGLHTGNAVAGVIGKSKFAYDLWGDSINIASRMESTGASGKIHVSEDFKNALGNRDFKFEDCELIDVKGKGLMKTYFLL